MAGKGFFERIADLINGRKGDEASETKELKESLSKVKSEGANSIAKQSGLLELIVKTIASNYQGMQADLKDKTLTVWIKDGIFYDSVDNSDFLQELQIQLSNQCGVAFGAICLKNGEPSDCGLTELKPGVWLQINQTRRERAVGQAVIRVVEGYGSTIESEYWLKSESGKRYNIGCGKRPMLDSGGIRLNDIAIDDDGSSPQYDNNKYVSRAHAHITYEEQFGFLFSVEMGGTRAMNHRTQIDRKGSIVELSNPNAPVLLEYGDCIVLSKKVRLMFSKE